MTRERTAAMRDVPTDGDTAGKRYDATYFERWYRRSAVGVGREDFVGRKVRLAVASAEYLLGHKVKNALDVGCGEAPWRAHLRKLRPGLEYVGVDPSDYAVERYGRRRNILKAGLGQLEFLGLKGPFDLVVCSDVLHYVRSPDVRAGLDAIGKLVGGVAFIEAFTAGDEIEGDRDGFQNRTAAVYERFFADAGLTRVGPHLYVGHEMFETLVDFEGRRKT